MDIITHSDIREMVESQKRIDGETVYAYLSWCRSNLTCADLSYANLSSANLAGAKLSRANLSYANLSYANLSYANLGYANLSKADLSHASITNVDLTSTELTHANLTGTGLSYANLGKGRRWEVMHFSTPSGDGYLVPTPDGWRVSVGCFHDKTLDDLLDLIEDRDEWPEATGEERERRRPALAAAYALAKAHTEYHADKIEELARIWLPTTESAAE